MASAPSDSAAPDAMQTVFTLMHALSLQHADNYSKRSPTSSESTAALERIEHWARSAGVFDPRAIISPHNLPLFQALLALPKPPPRAWLEVWFDRYGSASIFESPDPSHPGPMTTWMTTRILQPLTRFRPTFSKEEIAIAVWLVDHAPPHQWDPAVAGPWLETLRGTTRSSHSTDLDSLIEALDRRGAASRQDPQRPIDRWSSVHGLQQNAPSTDASVACLSGRTRSLWELWTLQGRTQKKALPDSPARLPDPPHARRKELVRDWILPSDLPVDQARARLWSATQHKEEVLSEFLLVRAQAQARSQSELVQRMDAILTAPDGWGRSFLAWSTAAFEPTSSVPGDLRRALSALSVPLEILDHNGRGLIHQSLLAPLAGCDNDPFHRMAIASIVQSKACVAHELLGSPEHYAEWVDALIDGLSPADFSLYGSSHSTVATALDLLPEGSDRFRLEQARLFHRAMTHINAAARDADPLMQRRNSVDTAPWCSAIADLTEHLRSHPIALDLGVNEWRQWGVLGRNRLLETHLRPFWMNAAHMASLVALDALVLNRATEHDLLRQTAAASPTLVSRRLRL